MSNVTAAALSSSEFRVTFPAQTAQGTYALTVGPQVLDLYGQPMSQAYTGTFAIGWATVQGIVTETNGLPVTGVLLQPDNGGPPATTDTNGSYVLGVPPAGTVHVVPSRPGLAFIPSSRGYTGVTTPIRNENYVAVNTVAPTLTSQVQTHSFIMNWCGLSGVTYQLLYSTDLVKWASWGFPMPGTNGPLQTSVLLATGHHMFFRVEATY